MALIRRPLAAIAGTTASSLSARGAIPKAIAHMSTSTVIPEFRPRQTFPVSDNITRSYFLGHHHAALERMRRILSNVGLVIECRDFRVPLTSWNPLLERTLMAPGSSAERARIIVYTKRDLGPDAAENSGHASHAEQQTGSEIVRSLSQYHRTSGNAAAVVFLGKGDQRGTADRKLLEAVKRVARDADSLTGLRALVVGMPNAGKSTLLNRLRTRGMGAGVAKAAATGAQPGVTRKLGTPVRIVPGDGAADGPGGMGEGVFVVDTPGVFVPYVSDAESMLKLALVGCVKDGVISHVTIADYLLYRLNLVDPHLYEKFCAPTNDVHDFLEAVARRTGKLRAGGRPNLDAAADWIVQDWRRGNLGRFVLDHVTPETIEETVRRAREPVLSMNQAKKMEKELRKAKNEAKRSAAVTGAAP
jgi:ribosome biogenesis GTPase A